MTLYGSVVLDISQHFVERWNEVKKRKVYYPCKANSYVTFWTFASFSIEMIGEQQLFSPSSICGWFCMKQLHLARSTPWSRFRTKWSSSPYVTPFLHFIPFKGLLLGHPHLQRWREIGHKYKQYWHGPDANLRGVNNQGQHRYGTCRVQVVRSVCDWSHGVLTEPSIQAACACSEDMCEIELLTSFIVDIQLIKESEHYIYIGKQILSIASFYDL